MTMGNLAVGLGWEAGAAFLIAIWAYLILVVGAHGYNTFVRLGTSEVLLGWMLILFGGAVPVAAVFVRALSQSDGIYLLGWKINIIYSVALTAAATLGLAVGRLSRPARIFFARWQNRRE